MSVDECLKVLCLGKYKMASVLMSYKPRVTIIVRHTRIVWNHNYDFTNILLSLITLIKIRSYNNNFLLLNQI